MTERGSVPRFVGGLIEGFFAPVVELVVGVLIGASITISDTMSSATGTQNVSPNISLIFTVIAVVDILRNIISCLFHTQWAIGNVIGNIFGLFVFYNAISFVSPESADSALFWTIVMTASLVIGVVITIWQKSRESKYY